MINAIKNDAEKRFGGLSPDNIDIFVAYTQGSDLEGFLNDIKDAFPGFSISKVDPLSLSVACHIGTGAIAIACCKKLK